MQRHRQNPRSHAVRLLRFARRHLDPDETVTHSETLNEPPPDPYDYPYSYAEDNLAGLDFTDLPTSRPTGDPPDVDIPALTTDTHTRDLPTSGDPSPCQHLGLAAELKSSQLLYEDARYG